MKRAKKFQTSQAGFTLVEILVVMIIGAMLVSATGLVVNNLHVIARQSKDLTLANAYAENRMESLRSIGFLGIEEGSTDFTSDLPPTLRTPRSAVYTVTLPSPELKQIDMTISYHTGRETKTLTYRSYIGELGVGQY